MSKNPLFPRCVAGFALAVALLPPALAQSAHLAPAAPGGSAEVRLHDAAPGQRVLLFDREGAHVAFGMRPEITLGEELDVRQLARAGGLGRLVASGEVDPLGALRIMLPDEAFAAQSVLAVALVGQGTVTVLAELRLPATVPVVPRLSNLQSREILVTEFMKDPAAVSDTRGEWIEFFNTTLSPIDIEGWVLTDDGSDRTVLQNGGNGIVIGARTFVVLGRNADPTLNGGVNLNATYSGFTLANGADQIILSRPNGQLSDAVRYLADGTWPSRPGTSLSLSIRAWFTGHDDVARGWCEGRTPMPMGDLGTPGAVNDLCL